MGNDKNYIPFILGEETRPKIELFEKDNEYSIDITQSIFYKQYCTALSCIADLISYNNEYYDNDKHKTRNNIIIFTGDRGSGKTSCMMTVKKLLCNNHKKLERYENIGIAQNKKALLTNTTFHQLDTIGPIYFDQNHNIMELFLGSLYAKFINNESKEQEKPRIYNNNLQNLTDRGELLNKFSEVKRNLTLLYNKECLSEYDNLEELKDLTASMSLRNSMYDLVQTYIKYMHHSDDQLIIDIDDIDLNMTNAYEMIEQIRKYLKIPGLIILMSLKIDQLANVVNIKNLKEYETLLQIDKVKYREICQRIVEKFLVKTFPLSQRVKLPKVNDILERNFKFIQPTLFPDGKKKKELSPLKEGLLALIYQKTGLLFYNTPKHPSFIIPTNLRELLNFIHKLYDLEDASNHNEATSNLFYFKDYFFNTWCTNNLLNEDLTLIRKANKIIEPLYINKLILNILQERFPILQTIKKEDPKDKLNSISELSLILDNKNMAFNISLGDVLACIDWLEKVCVDQKELMFLFAIKVFYTINLYENFKYKNEYKEAKKENKNNLTNNKIGYFDILNGNFFNSEYLNIAPYEEGKLSRIKRPIYCKTIKLLWNYDYKLEQNNNEDLKNISELIKEYRTNNTDDEKKALKKMAEFFMLTTSYTLDSNQSYTLYRKRNTVYYDYLIAPQRKEVCFDFLSIFYNILDISKTYEKYNLEEYDSGSKKSDLNSLMEKFPLFKDIITQVKNTYKLSKNDKAAEHLIYITNIRQVEIIEKISLHLQRNRPKSSDILDVYENIFDSLAKFSVESYGKNNSKGNNYSYSFFKVFKELMEDIKKTELLKKIFKKIMNEEKDTK
ncbi:MAG: hypothetical protein E7097_01440 [Bacteroides sp.]|nr:hypothetical protein [Bacteroides sp.]